MNININNAIHIHNNIKYELFTIIKTKNDEFWGDIILWDHIKKEVQMHHGIRGYLNNSHIKFKDITKITYYPEEL